MSSIAFGTRIGCQSLYSKDLLLLLLLTISLGCVKLGFKPINEIAAEAACEFIPRIGIGPGCPSGLRSLSESVLSLTRNDSNLIPYPRQGVVYMIFGDCQSGRRRNVSICMRFCWILSASWPLRRCTGNLSVAAATSPLSGETGAGMRSNASLERRKMFPVAIICILHTIYAYMLFSSGSCRGEHCSPAVLSKAMFVG